ncbi:hypothetical protein A9Q82_07890 [Cycloclasticus sp. 46_120_T64]|nr:hypothetical protein A9Q82_07890 [Cycloclasticus sp. 46_120_T64]
MENSIVDQWFMVPAQAGDSSQKIAELYVDSFQQLSQMQADVVSSCCGAYMEQLGHVAELGMASELLSLQSNWYLKCTQKILDSTQDTFDVAMESKQVVNTLLNEVSSAVTLSTEDVLMKPVVSPIKSKQTVRAEVTKPRRKRAAAKPIAKKLSVGALPQNLAKSLTTQPVIEHEKQGESPALPLAELSGDK